MVEAFHVRPVLLGIDRPVPGCTQRHLTIECLREDTVEITLVTGDSGAIGEDDSDRRDFRGRARRFDECRAEIEEMRPFSRVLGGRRFAVGAVDEGVRTIAKQPTFRDLGSVQPLSPWSLATRSRSQPGAPSAAGAAASARQAAWRRGATAYTTNAPNATANPAQSRMNAGPRAAHQSSIALARSTPKNGVVSPATSMMKPRRRRTLGARDDGAARTRTTPKTMRRAATR